MRDETESRIVAAVTVSGARQRLFHERPQAQTDALSGAASGQGRSCPVGYRLP